MVEKQASSEIAQSRERFEKWYSKGHKFSFVRRTDIPEAYEDGETEVRWYTWQAAERDTRERCGQERKELLKNLASAMRKVLPSQLLQDVIDQCDPLSAFLREIGEKSLAECIRGKE